MKLAFIAPRFPEAGVVGGAETLLRNLADYAADQGCEVDFLTTCAKNHHTWANEIPSGQRSVGGLTVHHFPVNEDRDLVLFATLQDRVSKRQNLTRDDQVRWLKNSVNSRALEEHLQITPYDAVVAGPYLFGMIWSAMSIKPERNWLVPCLHDECFAYQEVIGDMFREVHGILFNAEPEKQLAECLYGLSNKGDVVGMGLEPFKSDPEAFDVPRPYLLYSGRREPLKGTPMLLDYVNAFRRRTDKDLHLVLTGSGDFEVPEGLEGCITDAGFVSEEDKHNLMAGAVAFIHPSVNESFGIVLLESFLAGTPGLVHARSEVLKYQCEQSGAGLWFRSYPEFEAMLLRLIDDRALYKRLSMNGQRYVTETYSWPAVGRRFFDALEG